ncbi:Crp/Fnr family transcriptional regulator [Listeria monocytogenes]|nr:Crp/Fnr family transcriptional regulator [Listeria monocytogenes]ECJ9745800.1 Crp/Fnr family transcriptional regulator [Listeria monocytogenes]EEO3379164.1 Crp/Fnr family transcriptional regulator [Listeria monocytogenes]EEO6566271.1 Crp/Fnr family transcriptional regulator [Listeria monocytogenes]EEO6725536.1 Crp/Fnr family transcriptional regulator [Listeria monocytogenes]
MSYVELFDKDVIAQEFNSNRLLHVLLDEQSFVIIKKKMMLAKNEVLFYENQVHKYIYFIESGMLGAYNSKHLVCFIGENGFIGIDSILENESSDLTVTAITKSVVWRFEKKEVMQKLMFKQEGLFFLYNNIKSLNQSLTHRHALQVADARERVRINLIDLGKTHGSETPHQIILPKIFTKKIIANYLNITPNTIYFLCKQFVNEGILEPDSHQLIINKNKI